MNYKDTVMTEEELEPYWRNPDECDDVGIAEDQAEITFKWTARKIIEAIENEINAYKSTLPVMDLPDSPFWLQLKKDLGVCDGRDTGWGYHWGCA